MKNANALIASVAMVGVAALGSGAVFAATQDSQPDSASSDTGDPAVVVEYIGPDGNLVPVDGANPELGSDAAVLPDPQPVPEYEDDEYEDGDHEDDDYEDDDYEDDDYEEHEDGEYEEHEDYEHHEEEDDDEYEHDDD